MARTTGRRTNPWIAFIAGAVAMLLLVLVWMAWDRTREATSGLRADLAFPHGPSLPSLPTTPPPEGPKLPQLPTTPR